MKGLGPRDPIILQTLAKKELLARILSFWWSTTPCRHHGHVERSYFNATGTRLTTQKGDAPVVTTVVNHAKP